MGSLNKANRIGYSQFLLSSQKNYTLTYFADHAANTSHDAINRYLAKDKLAPTLLWEHVRSEMILSPKGAIIFDDTVLDKQSAEAIELARWQYSGNTGGVINGIGVVTCVYYNPDLDRFWAIDYRIYAPGQDGKSKIDHVKDMLQGALYSKQLPFRTVLMDTWYATHNVMLTIDTLGKIFYCPLKTNRLVSRVDQRYQHIPAKTLDWSADDLECGQRIHIKNFPADYHVQLFRITVSTHRTDFVVTNDLSQSATEAVQEVYGRRYKIEELHRELKQVTGIEACQCRRQRIQRNHIACAFLVWVRLKSIAHKTGRTVYQLKQSLLDDYMVQQLRSPTISVGIA